MNEKKGTHRHCYQAGLNLDGVYILHGKDFVWGGIAGNIENQTDLIERLTDIITQVEDLRGEVQADADALRDGIESEVERATQAESDLADLIASKHVVYTHVQAAAAETWNIQHNLGVKILYVQVVDDTGCYAACEVDYLASTNNLLVLRFGIPAAGTATVKAI